MTDAQLAAAEGLYRALNLMPCACTYKWISPTLEVRTKACIRCKAMAAWEAPQPKPLPPATAAAEAALAELEAR